MGCENCDLDISLGYGAPWGTGLETADLVFRILGAISMLPLLFILRRFRNWTYYGKRDRLRSIGLPVSLLSAFIFFFLETVDVGLIAANTTVKGSYFFMYIFILAFGSIVTVLNLAILIRCVLETLYTSSSTPTARSYRVLRIALLSILAIFATVVFTYWVLSIAYYANLVYYAVEFVTDSTWSAVNRASLILVMAYSLILTLLSAFLFLLTGLAALTKQSAFIPAAITAFAALFSFVAALVQVIDISVLLAAMIASSDDNTISFYFAEIDTTYACDIVSVLATVIFFGSLVALAWWRARREPPIEYDAVEQSVQTSPRGKVAELSHVDRPRLELGTQGEVGRVEMMHEHPEVDGTGARYELVGNYPGSRGS